MRKLKLSKARILGIAIGVSIVAGVWFLRRPTPIVVDTAVVDHRALESTVEADGRTRVRERFVVVAPVSGRLERITRVEGAAVHTGDVVARLWPVPLDSEAVMLAHARVDAARALALEAGGQTRVARATLDQRQRELSRALRLADAGGASPREVEECRLAVLQAEEAARGVEQHSRAAEAEVRQAEAVLGSRDGSRGTVVLVRSPAAGRVLRVPERSERIVAAGTPIIEIGDPATLEVVIDVLSSDAASIHPGDLVRFAEWSSAVDSALAPALAGRVREVEPAGFTKVSALGVDEQRVNIIADIASPPTAVGDGFRVEASIVVWSSPNVIALPRSALLQSVGAREGDGVWNVFVVRDGRVETRRVQVGHLGSLHAEILGGVGAGDQVVLFPSDKIAEGARVRSRKS